MLKDTRKKIREMLLGRSRIDRLMTDKVDDYILIQEQPLPLPIGDRILFIGNLTVENNYKFWEVYGQILANMGLKFVNFELIANSDDLYKALMIHKQLYKQLIQLIKKTIIKQQAYFIDKDKRKELKWKNCSWRYFKKHVTMELLLQICFLVYMYNFDAEKKNWQIILGKMQASQLMETYMYAWLQNLDGITGKFLLPHITKPSSWSQDGASKISIMATEKDKSKVKKSNKDG